MVHLVAQQEVFSDEKLAGLYLLVSVGGFLNLLGKVSFQ